jgi:hypothetical protein
MTHTGPLGAPSPAAKKLAGGLAAEQKALRLPVGRRLGELRLPELKRALRAARVCFDADAGHGAVAAAYQEHIESIRAAGADQAERQWKAQVRGNACTE